VFFNTDPRPETAIKERHPAGLIWLQLIMNEGGSPALTYIPPAWPGLPPSALPFLRFIHDEAPFFLAGNQVLFGFKTTDSIASPKLEIRVQPFAK